MPRALNLEQLEDKDPGLRDPWGSGVGGQSAHGK